MAVGVETRGLLLPLTLCGSSGCVAPHPPLRQAAGRYVQLCLGLMKKIRILDKKPYWN